MDIETGLLDRITPYPKNARKIPQKAIDKVARSLEAFGWQQPIVVDKHGVIVAGHARWLAKTLGWTEAPVHVASKLTPAQIRAYRLMDNRSRQETDWDLDLLGLELAELKELDLDLSLTGFDSRELDALLLTLDERADDAPPLPDVAYQG
jgi:ParB-like chromosome segregation protein Spo0J